MTENIEKFKALKLIDEGLQLRDQGFFKQVINKWDEALTIFHKLGLQKEIADLSIEIGNAYLALGRESKANGYYQTAAEIYETLNIPKTLRHISMKERQIEGASTMIPPEDIPPRKFTLKIIVVGDPAVGKTSLIRRHATDKFEESYAPTIGTDFVLKVVNLKDMEITCTIWDIGGHEGFMNIRNVYYEGADGAVIIYDVTRDETFKHVKKWYDDYTKVIGIIPTVIIGNKIDLEKKVKSEAAEKLALELHAIFYESSAKTGENVNKAFGHLANSCFKV
ncbi:MAG: GTP-binding protein [Candidatus Helarchaeota archaeon]